MRTTALPLALLSMALVACNPSSNTPATAAPEAAPVPATAEAAAPATSEPVAAPAAPQQTLHFVGPADLTISLTTEDNFATATMQDNSDRSLPMRSTAAADGMRMEGPNGEFIHIKGDGGVVQFVENRPIDIQAFRK